MSTNTLISGCGFHHVAIITRDWDKSMAFYCDGLGFVPKINWGTSPRRAVMLDVGDGNYLEVFERDVITANQAERESVLDTEPNLLHLCLRTDDCAAAVEVARNAGANVTVEATVPDVFTQMGLKTKIAFVCGPDGEIIEFFESSDL